MDGIDRAGDLYRRARVLANRSTVSRVRPKLDVTASG